MQTDGRVRGGLVTDASGARRVISGARALPAGRAQPDGEPIRSAL